MDSEAQNRARLEPAADSVSSTLLKLLKTDDPNAWRRLLRLFGPVVYGWCRQTGLQSHDASDVGQEVFRAVAAGISRFQRERKGDSFRGWLWTITRSKIQDHWRRRQSRPEARGGSSAREQMERIPAPDWHESADSTDGGASVSRRALEFLRAEFGERTWRAFWRTTVGRQRPEEVAAALGTTVNAVYLARSRVLRRLREEFGELLE